MSRWLLVAGDFTTLGGMDRANHAQASYLARRGDQVDLVAHRVSGDLRDLPGVHVHEVSRPLGAHLAGAPLLAREAARQRRAHQPSARMIVNGGNADPGAAAWVHYLHAAYEPVVESSFRSRLAAALGRRYHLHRERRAITRAPLVICNSRRTADAVQQAYGVPRARIRVSYYGVDGSQFAPVSRVERERARRALGVREGRRLAVFIGALSDRRKGFDALFDAWRHLAADPAWDVDIVAAGAGSEVPAWEKRIALAGLASSMRLLGFRADIAAIIAAADVLVHPVRYEAYGLGVHEAICRGLPAIVTAAAGIAERYPPELRGLLLPDPPNAAQLANVLRAWRQHADAWPARVKPFALALRERSWDDMAAEIAALVEAA